MTQWTMVELKCFGCRMSKFIAKLIAQTEQFILIYAQQALPN